MKMKISGKIASVSIIPFVVLLVLTGIIVNWQYQDYSLTSNMLANIRLFEQISKLANAIQAERNINFSVGTAAREAETRSRQRGEVDQLLPECLAQSSQVHLKGVESAPALIREVAAALQDARARVDSASGKAAAQADLAEHYRKIIQKLFDIQMAIANSKTGKGIGKSITSMTLLEVAKENTCRLTGILTHALARKQPLADGEIANIIKLESEVGANVDSPALVLGEKARRQLDDAKSSDSWKQSERIFNDIVLHAKSGTFRFRPADALSVQNRIAGDINQILDMSLLEMTTTLEQAEKHDLKSLLTLCGALAVMIVIVILVSVRIAQSISRPIVAIARAAAEIARGNLHTDISIRREDEVGELADAFRSLIATQKKRAEIIDAFSSGNLTFEFELLSEHDRVGQSLKHLAAEIRSLIDTIGRFGAIAANGHLNDRLDASRFRGDYQRLAAEVNEVVGTLVGFIDVIPSVLMAVDTNLNILYANKACAAVVGETQQSIIGKKCYTLFKTGDCQNEKCAVTGCMKNRCNVSSETDAHPQDMDLDISYTGVPLFDRDGKVVGAFEWVTDMTAVKQARRVSEKQSSFQAEEVRQVSECLGALAQGDLTREYQVHTGDSDTVDMEKKFSDIATAMNETTRKLNDTLSAVFIAIDQVNQGAMQISDAGQSLSNGATQQAASLEEITSSMTQIGSHIRSNAEHANTARTLSHGARDFAGAGADNVRKMVDAMKDISKSSEQVARVNRVIDDIAFQTNLLALNAAVEAARAGAHGKGFAVVAGEVRNLAGRSAKAAQETAEIIEDALKKVENGLQIAEVTQTEFQKILKDIVSVADLVGEIAAASTQQAEEISQINSGLTSIDQVTQQNTAHAEETAAASEELSGQSAQLKSLVSQFVLKG